MSALRGPDRLSGTPSTDAGRRGDALGRVGAIGGSAITKAKESLVLRRTPSRLAQEFGNGGQQLDGEYEQVHHRYGR